MDYTQIADNDPGGDLDSAYAAMIAQTVLSSQIVMVTDKTMARALGLSSAMAILGAIQSAIDAQVLPARIMSWLESDGIDVNHAETRATIDALVPTYLSEAQATVLKSLGNQSRYPGLTKSALDKARRLRAEGKA